MVGITRYLIRIFLDGNKLRPVTFFKGREVAFPNKTETLKGPLVNFGQLHKIPPCKHLAVFFEKKNDLLKIQFSKINY